MNDCYFTHNHIAVPRKVLKDQFDASVEPDEPQQIDMDQNQDELYDEDQFYRESEAIPPAPKLHRELATSDTSTIIDEPSTSANPPMRSRDSSQLEGNLVVKLDSVWLFCVRFFFCFCIRAAFWFLSSVRINLQIFRVSCSCSCWCYALSISV